MKIDSSNITSKKSPRTIPFLVFCLLVSVSCLFPSKTFANFDYNPNCQQAMQAALDLRLNDARSLLAEEKRLHPENGYVIYLEHYTDAIELIVTEDEKIYEKLIGSYEARMEQMDLMDDSSPQKE